MLGDKDDYSKNEAQDLEIRDEDNINMFTTDLYSYTVTIVRKY